MSENDVIVLICCFIISIIVVAIVASIIGKKLREKEREIERRRKIDFVAENSKLVKEVEELNAGTNFKPLEKSIELFHYCNSLREFTKVDGYELFSKYSYDERERIREMEETVRFNEALLASYNEEYQRIAERVETENLGEDYYVIERKMIKKKKLSPNINFNVVLTETYSSPKGKNQYMNTWTYTSDETDAAIHAYELKLEREAKARDEVACERAKMTPSLRYDVFKRDGFRCTICGRTKDDGIKLHVDHIKPVSKGGKTVISNLRTLCDLCNQGKSDKYDEDGLN